MGSSRPAARPWTTAILAVLLCAACAWFAQAQDTQASTPPDPDALARGMTGELLKNIRFDKWEGGKPVGWSFWNPAKGSSVKPGPEGPDVGPTVELVPGEGGNVDFTTAVITGDSTLSPGDTLLLSVTLKVDEGVPMEILLNFTHGINTPKKTPQSLPFQGDGNWNTLQYTLTEIPNELSRIDLAIRVRGAKQGTAYVSYASLQVSPQI